MGFSNSSTGAGASSGASTMAASSAGRMSMGASVGGAAASVIAAYGAVQSQQRALDSQAAIAKINAQQSELSAQQELMKGQQLVGQITQRAGQIKGSQKVSLAANGLDLGVGTAAEVLTSTDLMKETDVNTATANAVRAAWGYRTQGTNYGNQATMLQASGGSAIMAAGTSLLSGASSVASNWYRMNKAGVFDTRPTMDQVGVSNNWFGTGGD